jgi:ketosteroid isomerase-like protein
MSQENVALVRGLYDRFAEGNIAALLAALSPQVIWNEAENFPYADRNPYRGPDAVGEGLFARIAADWELAVLPHEFLDAGDTVVALGRFKGRLKANGRALDAQFAHVFRVRDGRIVAFDEYADTWQAAQAMGRAGGESTPVAEARLAVATLIA